MMKIVLASDHAGVMLKELIVKHLKENKSLVVEDLGPFNNDRVDYPDYAFKASKVVSEEKADFGIIVCGSGIGVSIVANKVKGIRAALCTTVQLAKLSRQHNDANVLCLGERILKEKNALMIVDTFLKTDFEAGRHQARVEKIHSNTGW